MNILLVEPDNILRRTITQALESDGHFVLGVEGAQPAVDQLDKNNKFDLVILELQLAGHGGVEFLYECRSYREWQDVPVVIHSLVPASKLVPSQKILDLLGVKSYLYKPSTSLQKLSSVVNDLAAAAVS